MKKMNSLQSLVLLIGTLFAWVTVYLDFSRFYNLYGTLTKIGGCTIPNPIATPCFYGAFAFLSAFIWSVYIQKLSKNKRASQQKKLLIFLIAGTIFAWSNLALETYKFYLQETGPKLSCSGVATNNIFTTPCFIGSMLFLTSLAISFVINKRNKPGEILKS